MQATAVCRACTTCIALAILLLLYLALTDSVPRRRDAHAERLVTRVVVQGDSPLDGQRLVGRLFLAAARRAGIIATPRGAGAVATGASVDPRCDAHWACIACERGRYIRISSSVLHLAVGGGRFAKSTHRRGVRQRSSTTHAQFISAWNATPT